MSASRRTDSINKIMEGLCAEWGIDQVERSLERLRAKEVTNKEKGARFPKKSAQTAVSMVENLKIDSARRVLIIALAKKFDERVFLPTVSYARQFMYSVGKFPNFSTRATALRSVLTVLKSMPIDSLRNLAESELFHGPTTVGPLSDAILNARREMNLENKEDIFLE